MGDYYIRISLMANGDEKDIDTVTFDTEVEAQDAYADLSAVFESLGKE
jgi:hypothetical protein